MTQPKLKLAQLDLLAQAATFDVVWLRDSCPSPKYHATISNTHRQCVARWHRNVQPLADSGLLEIGDLTGGSYEITPRGLSVLEAHGYSKDSRGMYLKRGSKPPKWSW